MNKVCAYPADRVDSSLGGHRHPPVGGCATVCQRIPQFAKHPQLGNLCIAYSARLLSLELVQGLGESTRGTVGIPVCADPEVVLDIVERRHELVIRAGVGHADASLRNSS